MGKYILIVTFSIVLGTSLYAYQSQQTSLDTTEENVERQTQIIARQIARSAFNMGFSEVKREFDATLDLCRPYEGGSFELATSHPKGHTVQVRSVGRYGVDACSCSGCPQYAISGQAIRDPNGAFSGVTVDGPLKSANLSGGGKGPVVSGWDAAGNQARNAISLSESGDEEKMKDEFCRRSDEDVQGIGGKCDVVQDPDIDLEPLNEEVSELEETHDEEALCGGGSGKGKGPGKGKGGPPGQIGSPENPAMVKIEGDCKLSGNSGGNGILYVEEGTLEMSGNSEWDGLILVAGDEGGEFEASKGTPRVEGSLAFYEGGSLDMRGNAEVQFNSDAVTNVKEKFDVDALKGLMDSPVRETVQMTDRRGGSFDGPGE